MPIRLCPTVLALALLGCFPKDAGEGLPHFEQRAPALGEPVPDLELRTLEGDPVRLAELVGGRPLVLQLGSHSCPVYRYRRFGILELQDEYRDRVDFVVVYTREAHPVGSSSPYREGEWDWWGNRLARARIRDAANAHEREVAARFSRRRTGLRSLFLVDPMDDRAWERFGSAPSSAFVVDSEGRIALRQAWVDPAGLRRVLDRLLGDEPPTAADPGD